MTHGTSRCYWNGCRRDECKAAHASYERRRWRKKHSRELQDTEFVYPLIKGSVLALAKETGVSEWTLHRIKRGGKRIRQSTERKILQAA